MPKVKLQYKKPWLPIAAQVQKLKDRGLVIGDTKEAERTLRYANYYRFTGFCLRFQYLDKTTGERRFIDGTSFEDIADLCSFDAQLRDCYSKALEIVDKTLNIAPQVPDGKNWKKSAVSPKSVAFVALMLNWMLAHDSVKSTAHKEWQKELEGVIDGFLARFPKLAPHSGFTPAWKKNPLWWQV